MTPGSQVTLATSMGPIWLSLLVHVLGGAIALVSGFVAIAVTKGGRWHRRAGVVFVVSMIVMAVFTTVRPLANVGRTQHIALMIVALLVALFELTVGFIALGRPRGMINGVPGGMMLFMGTIALLAGIGDGRVLRAGGIQGTGRVARHLWRMCFALFIASGSFFLGQMKFVPEPFRILPLMAALGVGPLFVLLYWMWRVRLRHSLRGIMLKAQKSSSLA